MTATTTIDALAPIALLDVDNVLDNQYWSWCPDTVMDDAGGFLEDADLTYTEFEIGPGAILPAGTTVVMPYLWGWSEIAVSSLHMSAPVDYEITLPKAASVKHVVRVILSAYYAAQEAQGATGRYFYIEAVTAREDGKVEIVWGT